MLATTGLAATTATVRDASDTPVVLDLQYASLETRGSRLEAKVSFYDDWSAADLLASTGPPARSASICGRSARRVQTRRTSSSAPPRARHAHHGERAQGDRRGLPARADSATVSVSGRILTLRFRPAAIGSPRRLRFAAEATQALGCKRPRGCVDRAPNGSRTGSFALG